VVNRVQTLRQKKYKQISEEIISCKRCPRLVAWREKAAREKVKRFMEWKYWGKPIPGFGDIDARVVLVGLAPAAHGGNRTGRMFTGDRSGDWLFRALWKAGFASQSRSTDRDDGMQLRDCFITATCRCAPPLNKLLTLEIRNCRTFLFRELGLLYNVAVVVGLGKIGFDNAFTALSEFLKEENPGSDLPRRPRFSHGVEVTFMKKITLVGSYHPSQQNTFTGRLTEDMLDSIFRRIHTLIATNRKR
jgi:uracil-DNA glycosylase family 4